MSNEQQGSGDFVDVKALFGPDYLHFYEGGFSAERNEREADTIWKLLELRKGHSVLDLGCGHGRIANELARRGAKVTGLDATELFLDRARRDAKDLGIDVEYVKGDMRELPWRNEFNAVLIWFTTFGYFDEADNDRVLRQAASALKQGGRLLIEQLNRIALLNSALPTNHIVRRGDDLMIDLVDYDGLTDRSHTDRIVVRDGNVASKAFSIRLYGFSELSRLLRDAGFRTVEGYGQGGNPFALYGPRLITVAKK